MLTSQPINRIMLVLGFLMAPAFLHAEGKGKDKENEEAAKPNDPASRAQAWLDKKLGILKKDYRDGVINDRVMWQRLHAVDAKTYKVIAKPHVELKLMEAVALKKAKMPLAAASFAVSVLKNVEDPLKDEWRPAWELLADINHKTTLHDLLSGLSKDLGPLTKMPPGFGNDWHYYEAAALMAAAKNEEAIAEFSKLQLGDRSYMPGRYQKALLLVELDKLKEAEAELKIVTSNTTKETSALPPERVKLFSDYAYLALGRVQYELKDYMVSMRSFRNVSRDGPLFYDALFEQSWSLFLAGYPNHALGALYGSQSPYFKDRFNPEVPVVRSFVYYWMCRYEDSRTALAEFIENHSDAVNKLGDYLDRKSLTPDRAYELFENLLSGVSEEALGISRNLLLSVSTSEPMILSRDQYADVTAEISKLKRKGIYGSRKNIAIVQETLNQRAEALRGRLGETYIAELQAMREHFQDLRAQSDFLYLELLMSEKEQLTGKELHADTKIAKLDQKAKVKGWAKNSQAWAASKKNEYWWDEVGYYVLNVKPKCNATPE